MQSEIVWLSHVFPTRADYVQLNICTVLFVDSSTAHSPQHFNSFDDKQITVSLSAATSMENNGGCWLANDRQMMIKSSNIIRALDNNENIQEIQTNVSAKVFISAQVKS